MLVRVLECVNGQVDASLHCEPSFDYERSDARWEFATDGYGEAIARGREVDPVLRLTTSLRLGFEGRAAAAHTTIEEGDRAFVALSWTDPDPPAPGTPTRRRNGWIARRTPGGIGSTRTRSRTIAGAVPCNGAPSY
jgi:alpha,alpha-trehalase